MSYDLSFGATHGIVFAGSGGFKTVSVCVPSLLSYRGSIVTLDPSTELEPMLRPARQALGHRVVAIDPARPAETGFNVLDWLDPKSATADADVHAIVDWVCGERRAATADAVNAAGQFFEGRGKAMVEALLSDLIFDPALSTAERTLARLAARLALPEKDMRTELERIHKESASARARHLAGQLKQLVKETFSGVYGNMSEQTEWLANARFAALVSGNAFHTRELAEGKLDLFLNIPMKVLETTPALARCIVGALLNTVYEAEGKLKSRVLFLLDEVARLGFMASLARARDDGRKFGITLVMIYQSEGQLVEQWGEDGRAAWFESVTWRSYSAVADVEHARNLGSLRRARRGRDLKGRQQGREQATPAAARNEKLGRERDALRAAPAPHHAGRDPAGHAHRRAGRVRARTKTPALWPGDLFQEARNGESSRREPFSLKAGCGERPALLGRGALRSAAQ